MLHWGYKKNTRDIAPTIVKRPPRSSLSKKIQSLEFWHEISDNFIALFQVLWSYSYLPVIAEKANMLGHKWASVAHSVNFFFYLILMYCQMHLVDLVTTNVFMMDFFNPQDFRQLTRFKED